MGHRENWGYDGGFTDNYLTKWDHEIIKQTRNRGELNLGYDRVHHQLLCFSYFGVEEICHEVCHTEFKGYTMGI